MKYSLTFSLSLATVSLILLAGCTNQPTSTTLIQSEAIGQLVTVIGEGKASVKPDTATISVEVSTLMKEDAATSQEKNNTISQSVIDGMSASGVARDDIRTTQYSLRRQERSYGSGSKTFEGWNTVHAFDITVPFEDLKDRLNHIIIGDEVNIRNVSLHVTDRGKAEASARQLALEDAQAEAKELVEVVGKKLGEVYDITEGRVRVSATPTCYECGGGGGGSVELADGVGELVYYVTVSYSIE